MILQLDDADNIITLLEICSKDSAFRLLVEEELKLLGLERRLTKKTRELIAKGVRASIGMSLNYEIEEEHTLEDMAIDKEQNTEDMVLKKIGLENLFNSIHRLPRLSQGVISYRFGLLGYTPKSYREIGALFHIHPTEVIAIEKTALKLLKQHLTDELIVDDYRGMVALLIAIGWGRREEDVE